jgi:hypothetical protein
VVAVVAIGAGLVWLERRSRPPVDPNLHSPQIRQAAAPDSATGSAISFAAALDQSLIDASADPLEIPLRVAGQMLEYLRSDVADYTATIVKQERVNDKLLDEEFLFCKIRNRSTGDPAIPLSVYLKFLKPQSVAGREVIWVEGRNGNRLLAHEAGLLNLATVSLNPTGPIAMRGNRYPISELGIENLLVRLIEIGQREELGERIVRVDHDVEVDGQPVTLLTITFPQARGPRDYYEAKIYVHEELNVPMGFEGFLGPEEAGGPPLLVERYFYTSLNLNVGLTDNDFSTECEEYDFP